MPRSNPDYRNASSPAPLPPAGWQSFGGVAAPPSPIRPTPTPSSPSAAAPAAAAGAPPAIPAGFQAAFFARMGGRQEFQALFDHLPGVHFFAKDCDGRIMAASTGFLQRLGFTSEEEIIGLTDADFHPPRTVREIRIDDFRVMSTRQPLIDRVEALFTRSQAKDWYVTTKLPIIDLHGEVIGIMGFVRPYQRHAQSLPGIERLERLVAHIHAEHARPLPVGELAKIAHLSVRQIHRTFHEVFGMSTQAFIVRTRVQAASDDLLLTHLPLSEIALAHGFSDQSAFTRRFAEHTGETPLKFRQRHRRADGPERPAAEPVVRFVQKDGTRVQDPGAETRFNRHHNRPA